jgi:hypothetical protein
VIVDPKTVRVRPLESLRKTALKRLPGYMEECLRRGQLDMVTQTVTFTIKNFNEIRQQYNPKTGVQIIMPGCC